MHQSCAKDHVEIFWFYGPCPLCAMIERHEQLCLKLGEFIGQIEQERTAAFERERKKEQDAQTPPTLEEQLHIREIAYQNMLDLNNPRKASEA